MSKRATLVLLAVVVALAAYIGIFERTGLTSKELSERAGRVLTTFVRDRVDRLEVTQKGAQVVLVRERDADGQLGSWKLLAPMAAKADQDVVDQVLGELEWLNARRAFVTITAEDEKRFGLDAPDTRLVYRVAGKDHRVLLGRDDVHGEGVYVRVDDEPGAYVVPKSLREVLAREPGQYRDKQLFPDLTVAWARRLVLTQGATSATLTKTAERWWLESAPRGYADAKRTDQLLHALAELRAARYVEPSARQAAQDAFERADKTLRVEVTVVPDETREDKAPKQLVLEVGGACGEHAGERYARASGIDTLACLSAEALEALTPPVEALRDLRLFAADASAIERIELVRGGDKLVLARSGEAWKLASGEVVDREAVEAWLADLAAARAMRVLAGSELAERGTLTLGLIGDNSERLRWGELSAPGEVTVRRGDEPLTLAFPGTVYDRLQPVASRFSALAVWARHQPSEVVRIVARAEGRTRTLALESGTWGATGAAAAVDAERVRVLVRALVGLRVRAHVAESPRPAHGLTPEGARVALSLQDGSTLSLELGTATERGAYARLDAKRVVEVGSEVVALVSELAGGPRAELPQKAASSAHEDDDAHDHEEDEEDGHDHAH